MRISGLTYSRDSTIQDDSLSPFFLFFSFHPFSSSNFLRSSSFIALRFFPPTFTARLSRPFFVPSCPPSSSTSSSSPHSHPRLSVSLPSFLRPSLFHLLPPFSPLSFPPLPFLPSPCLFFSLSVSLPVPSSLSHLLISLRTSGMRGLFIQERSLRRWPV